MPKAKGCTLCRHPSRRASDSAECTKRPAAASRQQGCAHRENASTLREGGPEEKSYERVGGVEPVPQGWVPQVADKGNGPSEQVDLVAAGCHDLPLLVL